MRKKKIIPYRVVWQIDVDATSPREAALLAHDIQSSTTSWATIYEVYDNRDEDVGNLTSGFISIDVRRTEE